MKFGILDRYIGKNVFVLALQNVVWSLGFGCGDD